MNSVARFLKMIPGLGTLIGSDASHKPTKQVSTKNPHANQEALRPALEGMHSDSSLQIPQASQMKIHNNSGQVIRVSGNISPADLQANPNVVFLFGDNVADHGLAFDRRQGQGGQAGAYGMEKNALGIPTLWKAPDGVDQSAYFSEQSAEQAKAEIDKAFAKIKPGQKVAVPVNEQGESSLGALRAQLKERAPSLLAYINQKISELEQAGLLRSARNLSAVALAKADDVLGVKSSAPSVAA